MLSKFKKFISIMIVMVMFSSIVVGCQKEQKQETPPSTETAKTFKAAMLLSGPINDGGWNTDAYNGLMKLKDMGYEIAYTENVKQSDQESIIREYAKKGYNFIIGHGFEYGDALTKVAADFPDIKFLQTGGASNNGKNLTSGEFKLGELAVVVAGIAAKTTKTNKIGFVGAMEIPTIQAEVATIKEEVPIVNPKASVTVAYIGSWTDINKGKEAALAQINNGVDVIIGIGDACDAGAIQACQEKGVKFIGWSGDFNKLAPDTVLTSGVQSVSTIVEEVGKKVFEDKFVAEHKIYGVKEGAMWLGEFSPTLDPKVKEEALQQQEDIKTGKLVTKNRN
jgi:basic membrane protein A and related proteins